MDVPIPLNAEGTYNLDFVLQLYNTNGLATQDNLTLNFTPIPEPSAVLLGAVGVAALAFRRQPRPRPRRADGQSQQPASQRA